MTVKGYRTNNPKYATVHIWLKKDKGDPSLHPCYFCGGDSKEWICLSNKTEKEFRQGAWVTFSKNIDDYVAGCRSCNMKLDKPKQTLCKNGHDNWIPNKNNTHSKRMCGTCKNERQKRNRIVARGEAK